MRSLSVHDEGKNRVNTCEPLFDRRLFTRGLIVMATACGFAVSPFSSVLAFADPTSAEKQAEADEVAKKLDTWLAELEQASAKYYLALDAHDAALAAMDKAQINLVDAEAEVTRLQGKLGDRVTSMYKQGKLGFLEVIFGAHSFYEFTSTWDLLININNDEATLIEQFKSAKANAQIARDEYAAQEKLAQEKLAEAEEIKANAEKIVAEFEATLASLEAEVAALVQKEREEEERRQREAALAAASSAGITLRGSGVPVFSGGVTDIICQAAYSRLGYPYVWGGNGPYEFDCSGLTRWCYLQAGINIARIDYLQRDGASSILPVSDAQAGDILWEPGHVGIYMGGGAYIHAPEPGDVVRYGYNMGKWSCACRY